MSLQSQCDWFFFHLSHDDDKTCLNSSLWPDCEKCREFYESLVYTSTDGEFGLLTKEILENHDKVLYAFNKLTY